MAKPKTILVVDDEPHLTYMLAHRLRSEGIEVHEQSNGQDGYTAAISMVPDLVITDYQMPRMSGIAMCQALRADARTAHVPVLMITGRGHRVPRSDLECTNVLDLMSKPFSFNELLAKVCELINIGSDDEPTPGSSGSPESERRGSILS